MSDADGTPLTCDACGYEWTYGGELQYATCPSCRSNVRVDAHKD